MRSKGFKVKPTQKDTAPTILVTVGVRVSGGSFTDGHGAVPHVMSEAVVCVRRRKKGRWGAVTEHHCVTVAGVWEIIDAIGCPGRRPYVVAARASDTLTLLRWWERVEAGECRIRPLKGASRTAGESGEKRPKERPHPLIIQGRPDVIGYTVRGCPFRWVSVSNWSELSLREMAESVGYTVPAEADPLDKWEAPSWPAVDQARLMMEYMTRLCSWWLSIGGGTWKDTPGAAAWSTFLRRGGENGLIIHAEEDALTLESRAVFGGRAACWWYGDCGDSSTWAKISGAPFPSGYGHPRMGGLHRYDVRAMYPTLLGSERFPVRLMWHLGRMDVKQVEELCKHHCVIAACTVESQRGELPAKGAIGPEYPVGDWHTVLTTPELQDAIRHRELKAVYEVAVYQAGRPFQEWSRWGLELRTAMKRANDRQGELLVKTLLNSLGGRLARRKIGWQDAPHITPREAWGQWYDQCPDTGEVLMYRALAYHTQEHVREAHRPGTLGACFAHLTAYGRTFMSRVRGKLDRRDVIWQDTDGIIVTDRGRDHIEQLPEVHPTRYGALRYERSFAQGRFLTPKHYWLDGRWVLAGIHDGFSVDDGMTSSEVLVTNPVRSAVRPDNAGIYQMVRHIDLSQIDPGVSVDEKGWAVPPKRTTGVITRKRSERQPRLPT